MKLQIFRLLSKILMVRVTKDKSNMPIIRLCYKGNINNLYTVNHMPYGISLTMDHLTPGIWEFQWDLKPKNVCCEIIFYGYSDFKFDAKFTAIYLGQQYETHSVYSPGN